MKVLQINSVCGYGSTGRIATDLYNVLLKTGNKCMVAYGRGLSPNGICSIRIGNERSVKIHAGLSRLTDRQGFYSRRVTQKFIGEVEKYSPDIIHLHNLHGYYLHLPTLFEWLKKVNKPIIWTLHDCWPFTGHCSHFDLINCNKWKNECFKCPQKTEYPRSILKDSSTSNYLEKKELFTGIQNLTFVAPSQWLADLVEQSFLNCYNSKVIPNGIDLNRFKPTKSDFRESYGLTKCKLLLGVSNVWDYKKGLDCFIKLSSMLSSPWKIVLVGLTKKQKKALPEGIIGIERTSSIEELAAIYSAADVYVNPTLEDNFPTTNLEALACGTQVITFKTGGSPESLTEGCGIVVDEKNCESICKAVYKIQKSERTINCCIDRAKAFSREAMVGQYVQLYESLLYP